MKKILLILLAILMLFAAGCKSEPKPESSESSVPAPSVPESSAASESEPSRPELPPEESYETLPEEYLPMEAGLEGEWFAEYAGLLLTLKLSEDGAFTFEQPGQEAQTGKWKLVEGLLILDNKADDPIVPVGEALLWDSADLLFAREKPETYSAAAVLSDAQPGDFDGYWKALYVTVGDGAVLSNLLGENTEVYIEGSKAALGGTRYGEIIRELKAENGALTLEESGIKTTIQLQEDGLLRVTVEGGDNPAVIILAPAAIPGEESDSESSANP